MSFEPEKFFINLMDFFSILLPGGLLTYVVREDAGKIIHHDFANLHTVEDWVIFLFSSYLLGHFIFLLGSWLMDDFVYDPVRKWTDSGQIKRLAGGKKLTPVPLRWIGEHFLFRRDIDAPRREAQRIRDRELDSPAARAINVFQWSKAKLTLEHPEAMESVRRFEADSKFFRSFFIVLFVIFIWAIINAKSTIVLLSAPALLLSFWRYVDQRAKSTTQAYWYVLTASPERHDAAEHGGIPRAGGVVFRRTGDVVKFLLVTASDEPKTWVLPKGKIEPGERMKETAVREVHEESGVWARVVGKLGTISFERKDKKVTSRFYLMEMLKEEEQTLEERRREWLAFDDALARASHDQSRQLLREAKQQIDDMRARALGRRVAAAPASGA